MATPSQEELDQLREKNDKLRAQIADANSQRASREAEAARQVQYDQLQAENVRLEAELANAKELAKVGVVKEGAAVVQQNVKDQLAQASALAAATVGPVDTNAENQPKDTGATVAVSEDKDGGNS